MAIETPPQPSVNTRLAAVVDWLWLGIALAIVVAIPKTIAGDAQLRFEGLDGFMKTGHLVSPKYSTVGPLLSSPLYWLGLKFGAARAFTSYFNTLIFVFFVAFFWRELSDVMGPRIRRLLLLLILFASMFMHHAQRYYGEMLTTVLVAIGVCWISRGHAKRAWALIILGAVNTPASLVAISGIAICHARRARSFWPLLGPVIAFGLMRLESVLVRDHLFDTGYNYDAGFRNALPYSGLRNFSYPFFFGLLSLLLSFGKGLIFFVPGFFIPLPASAPARFRWVHTTLVVYVCGLLLTYAKWWSWYGGWFWGPRFFLVASIPASFSLALNVHEFTRLSVAKRIIVATALGLSFWVGANGVAFQGLGLELCTENYFKLAEYCYYVPEMSVLWHPFVDGGSAIPPNLRPLSFLAVLLWASVAVWVGRELFSDLARRSLRWVVSWHEWW